MSTVCVRWGRDGLRAWGSGERAQRARCVFHSTAETASLLSMPGAQRTGEGYFVYLPANGDFPATYEAHWDAFLWWWTFSIFGCCAVVILSRVLLPLLLPASWEAMVKESPWKAVSVPKLSLIHI